MRFYDEAQVVFFDDGGLGLCGVRVVSGGESAAGVASDGE